MLWEVDIHPRADVPNRETDRAAAELGELGMAAAQVCAARGYLLEAQRLGRDDVQRLADELLVDRVVEETVIGRVGDASLLAAPRPLGGAPVHLVHVLPKAGVMDPVAKSAQASAANLGVLLDNVRTLRKYWFTGLGENALQQIICLGLSNDAIEDAFVGPLPFDRLDLGGKYEFRLQTVSLAGLDDDALVRLSRQRQLYLQLAEMQTIQRHFAELGRDPTDVELETIAQTWSEHCSHKTLAGRIAYRDAGGERQFENMLHETIFAATQAIRRQLANDDWCVSVFEDNAGVVRFNDRYNLAFKVETHNHPSALEPYGGANTGIGGVIRDILGTGLGAKPIASTDVFCFAPPDLLEARPAPADGLPPGVLHPRRVMRGVVAGVRDYGNRMGIPTVNGAVYFDERYLGNPLVFCGSVGLIPVNKSHKRPQPNDLIVALGGRTGRDGIHGATFSSAELTSESETASSGAVQIGNAIEEKKLLDVLLAARNSDLYTAVTDCGAGGFSSAVGEMGEAIGAEVWLERAPLKYSGLSYTEIWISEAQERMVLSVPEDKVDALRRLAAAEDVEATVLGRFPPTGRLVLKYDGQVVGDLSMEFLHKGRPPVVRQAVYEQRSEVAGQRPVVTGKLSVVNRHPATDHGQPTSDKSMLEAALLAILASPNVASKEWIIRQYDHEVQGSSVIKPLVGIHEDGPSDAAVLQPVLDSPRGVVLACGMNPHYGDFDPYHMAASSIDEAIRNCVAVGADPARIALLDNFCWGDCERPKTLGSLVRAAIACHDLAVALGTPFISGKDSLNNEFTYTDPDSGERRTTAIPPTLLVSAMGQVEDVTRCVTMDLKSPGNLLYAVGRTNSELAGSHWHLVRGEAGGRVPSVDPNTAKGTFHAVHQAIRDGFVRACHDLSEGGLAVAAAEMCFAGGQGARIDVARMPRDPSIVDPAAICFSESNSRFLCEVPPENADAFASALAGVPHAKIGEVQESPSLVIQMNDQTLIDVEIEELKYAWQAPFRW